MSLAGASSRPEFHETAVVYPGAKVARGVRLGPFSVIGEHVEVGEGTELDAHVVLDGWTRIGRDCRIGVGTVIGGAPQDKKYGGERSYVQIGDRNVIREYVTINRAADPEGVTRIGSDNYLMAFSHVAHNAVLGDGTVIVNLVGISGHVTVEDYATVGGATPVHQFVRVGAYAMIGGGFRVTKDVVPYAMVAGIPSRVYGLNRVGLKRNGFTAAQQKTLRAAFRILFWSGLNTSAAIVRLKAEMTGSAEVSRLVKFVETSERGITPGLKVGPGETPEEEAL